MTDPQPPEASTRTPKPGRVDKPTLERLCQERGIDIHVAYTFLWALADDGWWISRDPSRQS